MSGGTTGILKQLGDERAKSLAYATCAEDAGINSHGEMVSAKKK
jgi:hypothetical protein